MLNSFVLHYECHWHFVTQVISNAYVRKYLILKVNVKFYCLSLLGIIGISFCNVHSVTLVNQSPKILNPQRETFQFSACILVNL